MTPVNPRAPVTNLHPRKKTLLQSAFRQMPRNEPNEKYTLLLKYLFSCKFRSSCLCELPERFPPLSETKTSPIRIIKKIE